MKFLTISVIASFAVCLIFTATVIALNCLGVEVSDTLIQYFFTVFGIEFAAAAAIKISKHQIEKQKIKEKIDLIKEEGFEVEKTDLSPSDDNDEYIYSEGDDYYG